MNCELDATRITSGSVRVVDLEYIATDILNKVVDGSPIEDIKIDNNTGFIIIYHMNGVRIVCDRSGRYPFNIAGNQWAVMIDKVIFHDPATIVYWMDGTKTVVKCGPDDEFDPEKGLALCYMKKVLGNTGSYNNVLKKAIVKAIIEGEI